MKKSPVDVNDNRGKVVSLQLDAKFYFERAMQSLERHRYDKALKYFRLSIEKEPENPVNYCNLAGLLADLGRFEESNQVLETVLSEIDPQFYECLFYIANNYAYMGFLELAEDYLLQYMKLQPHGELIEEAEEMLHLLSEELGRPPKEVPQSIPAHMREHEKARKLLEEGQFYQASKLLQKIVQTAPDFWPAYNNLSLAYYYLGKIEEAIQLVKQVLNKDPHNLHAKCNLALFSHYFGDVRTCQTLIAQLKKLVPLNEDYLYKLATTLGILGEHETAYRLFYRMLKSGEFSDPSYYHYLAVAACNTGRLLKAKRFWERALVIEKGVDVPRFYLDQLKNWLVQPEPKIPMLQYSYHMPYEEWYFQLQLEKKLVRNQKMDSLLRDSFFWILGKKDQVAKAQAIQLLGILANHESEELLRQYLLQETDGDSECKKLALLMLRQMGAKPPYSIWLKNQLVVIEVSEGKKPFINQVWNQILKRCLEGMKHYSSQQQNDVKLLLFAFLKKQREKLPTVRRIGAWAAALEYIVAKQYGLKLTQLEVASKYEVSPSAVAYHVKKLGQFNHFTKP